MIKRLELIGDGIKDKVKIDIDDSINCNKMTTR
jgi:hypothetical protein